MSDSGIFCTYSLFANSWLALKSVKRGTIRLKIALIKIINPASHPNTSSMSILDLLVTLVLDEILT